VSPWRRVAAVTLVAACAHSTGAGSAPATASPSTSPSPSPAAPPPPSHSSHPRPPDVVRYGPSATRYIVTRHLHIEQAFGGQPQVQDVGARLFVTVAIAGPTDAGRYRATFTVDSIVPDSGTPDQLGTMMTKVRSLVFAGRLAPVGEFDGVAASDTTATMNLAQFVGNFRDFLPRIPATGAGVGGAWTDTVMLAQRAGGGDAAVSRRAVVRSTALGWEPHAGVSSLHIESAATYDVSGAGQNNGQAFELTGAGTGSAQSFLSEDGRYVGGESRDSTNLTVSLPTQGLTIPVIQVMSSTVTLRP